ncbi:uncharacterized protein LY89DRAFT_687962 [Mollisia scopiformis]|uniref:Uncharacterized protein n=1 Tax=Mollisia scopiformis TaxID=149040 RepID=A0A194WZQ5_MOLSC|nr:uncharacterized protein LY89DRAFT_687962 [Mollisia scopiformis]KUJ13102.1 hypothetical protein LY89DRAFT_687962 [Mollisia scopiformis]
MGLEYCTKTGRQLQLISGNHHSLTYSRAKADHVFSSLGKRALKDRDQGLQHAASKTGQRTNVGSRGQHHVKHYTVFLHNSHSNPTHGLGFRSNRQFALIQNNLEIPKQRLVTNALSSTAHHVAVWCRCRTPKTFQTFYLPSSTSTQPEWGRSKCSP